MNLLLNLDGVILNPVPQILKTFKFKFIWHGLGVVSKLDYVKVARDAPENYLRRNNSIQELIL